MGCIAVFPCKILSVSFEHDNIVFERRLKEGPGSSVYGLEVCRFLDMDEDFLTRAFEVRKLATADKTESTGISALKLSRYNRKKAVLSCEICGYSSKLKTDMLIDIHHIDEQHLADTNGMINGVHKHAKSNLVALCKQCHMSAHSDELAVQGYKSTLKRMKLFFVNTKQTR